MVRATVVLLLLLLLPSTVHAQKRVALVIGNASYQHAGELANPKNDANDMAAALRTAGFQVIEGYDLNKAALDRKIRDFATALRGAEAGLFFYAGHGLQVSGQNYIVPVDAELTSEAALDFEMVRLDLVHRTMEREAPTNILFLDACRNNPLARNLARAMGTRSAVIGRGLAPVKSGAGTLISFSTQPGNVALDGEGRNSPFAGALVKHLSSSQDDLGSIMIAVRNDVMEKTERKQVPWEHTAMTRRFYFKAVADVALPSTPLPQTNLSEAERAWNVAKDTESIAVLESFIARYKDTFYADLARERLEKFRPPAVTPTTSPALSNPTKNVAAAPLKPRDTEPTFSEAIGLLSQERSYAESGAALVKQYAPSDIETRRLYAEAKGAFDGLIEQLLADLAQNNDPELSTAFRERIDAAALKRVAFSKRADEVLKANVPEGAKNAILVAIAESLAKTPVELVKELFQGVMTIWKEWRGVSTERRKQITTRIEAQRWKPFAEITPAL